MISQRYKVFLWTGLLLALNWLSVAFLDPDLWGGWSETMGIGYIIGSLFAQTTLAAAWAALGPGRLLWRVPASLGWVLLLGIAIAINLSAHGGSETAALVIGSCFLAQWLVLQIPLWALKAGLQAHLRFVDDTQPSFDRREWQFGIRQLLIATTIIAILFGVGRITVGALVSRLKLDEVGEPLVVLFLACSAIFISLPLLLAGLLERRTGLGILIAVGAAGVGTLLEVPLVRAISAHPRPNIWDLLAMNVFTCALIVAVAMTVRINGYSLTRIQPGALSSGTEPR